MKYLRHYTFLLLILFVGEICAQDERRKLPPREEQSSVEQTVDQDSSKTKGLIVDSANSQFFDASTEEEKLYLQGDVRLTHDSVFMFCDTAVLRSNDLWANGNVSIIKYDTLKLFSDSLLYRGDSLMAYFVGNVIMENGEEQLFTSFLQYDLNRDWAIYTDTALIRSGDLEIKSKRGIFHADESYINFYESVTIDGPELSVLSDSLRYYTESKKALFLSPTVIRKGSKNIYSEKGFYNTAGGLSEFVGNAQYIDGTTKALADTIRNDETTGIIELINNAFYTDENDTARGKSITYNEKNGQYRIEGDGYFKNPENEVTGEVILYDKESGKVQVLGRSFLSTGTMLINADDLDYDQKAGIANASGAVNWRDTVDNFKIESDFAFFVDSIDFMKAFNDNGKPVLSNEINESDTLYLSGDTLVSYTEVFEEDTVRYFNAFANVEMINGEMQAVCDSINYNGKDSIFTLIGNPIMWSDSTQYTADTIVLIMKSNVIDSVFLKSNAMIITSSDFVYFDQIAGRNIDVSFIDGDIDRMNIVEDAQAVYYLKDDENAYMGVNETTCSRMIFLFQDKDLFQTRYYTEPTSRMTPMHKADHSSIQLPRFKWMIERRPKTVLDLYN